VLHEQPEGENHSTSRSLQDERKEARDQLTLVLGFFSRVDAKASALLAIDTGMLAILTYRVRDIRGVVHSRGNHHCHAR
jgi:hypothetical protein